MNRITPVQDVPPVLLRHFQGALEALHSLTPRVQVPNNHILAKILTYITTILKPST